MDADGKNQQRLTENRVDDKSPSWSPDGERIAFSSNREEEGSREIYVMDADGWNLRNLTNHPDSDGSPAWLNSPFPFLPQGKKSRYGDGSNRLTDNINYRLFLLCIGAAFENKHRVDLLVSILPLESDVL